MLQNIVLLVRMTTSKTKESTKLTYPTIKQLKLNHRKIEALLVELIFIRMQQTLQEVF